MTRIVVTLLSCSLFTACATTPSAQPTPSGSPSDPSPSVVTTPIPDDWETYSSDEVGISFRFPPMPGEVTYDFRSSETGDGVLYEWKHAVGDNSSGYEYPFAGGASRRFEEGRECNPTDAHDWVEEDGVLTVDIGTRPNCDFEVNPIGTVARDDGLEGIIFEANDYHDAAGYGVDKPEDLMAMLRFPEGQHESLAAILFSFKTSVETEEGVIQILPDLTIEDIELVLGSVEFFEPAT